jgi:hypothetical protein
MTRMGKEFSLVLLGAGILSVGAFAWPEEQLEEKAEKAAQQQVAGNNHTRYHGPHFIFLGGFGGGYNYNSARPPAMAGISKGGFGGIGRSVSASS